MVPERIAELQHIVGSRKDNTTYHHPFVSKFWLKIQIWDKDQGKEHNSFLGGALPLCCSVRKSYYPYYYFLSQLPFDVVATSSLTYFATIFISQVWHHKIQKTEIFDKKRIPSQDIQIGSISSLKRKKQTIFSNSTSNSAAGFAFNSRNSHLIYLEIYLYIYIYKKEGGRSRK